MLTELSVVEQRYLAVREALDGATITDVATRYGVDRRDDPSMAAALRERGSRCAGRPQLQARPMPAPDRSADRGQDRGHAPIPPGLGSPDHPVQAP
jgi:hypothetical protein